MKNILKIIKISRPLYPILALLALLIFIGAALNLAAPLISKFIVDEIIAQLGHKSGNLSYLVLLILLTFAANMLGTVVNSLSDRLGDHFAGKQRQLLTEKFYDHIFHLPQSYFDSEMSGKIVNQLNRGIFVIQNFNNTATNFILPSLLQSIFIITILLKFNWPTAVFLALLFPIYALISNYSAKKWGEAEEIKNKYEDAARGRITETIGNIKIVKGFAREKSEYGFVSKTLVKINEIYARQSTNFHWLDFARNTSLNVILLIVSVIVFYSTFQGHLTIGEMVLILQLVAQARMPLFAMSFILTQIQTAEAGSKEFFEILELPQKEDFRESVALQKLKFPTLEFKNISFKYSDDLVLNKISFTINKSETVALVGPSGAGKTTIVNLILKFYLPTAGEILLKDKKYSELSARVIRNNIALVFQENELFSTTIRENVAYGNTNATEKEIVESLKLANAWEFVAKFPKGMDTEVGERGVKLSGGQKQRIQIARAVLRNAPILILDEATSNLDARSEKEVQDALENLMRDKLVIVIAHRFSTLQNVNKVLVLENGKIVESGSPRELAGKPGIYQDLLRFQIEGNKKLLEGFELY